MKRIILLSVLFAAFTMNSQQVVFEDGFEAYDDFAITNIGNWTQIDLDGDQTYGSATYDFTNENYTGTAIIFNPSMAIPDASGTDLDPRTGMKGLYFFASTGNISGTPLNDDYFISPHINLNGVTGSELSLWARSYTLDFGPDQFEIGISTTGTEVADFTMLGAINMPGEAFEEFIYDLSAYDGTYVYIAIHCVSPDSFILMIDNFKVEATTLDVNDHTFFGFKHFINTSKQLNLSANTAMESFKLYNVLGQEVLSQNLNNTNEVLNISSLNTGVYIATVTIDGATKSFKIAKK